MLCPNWGPAPGITTSFDKIQDRFLKLYRSKAYVHHFLGEGMDKDEFDLALASCNEIIAKVARNPSCVPVFLTVATLPRPRGDCSVPPFYPVSEQQQPTPFPQTQMLLGGGKKKKKRKRKKAPCFDDQLDT